ncbi:hypothetical protein H6G04_18705 [Calothrix membranacea FACHB-236]|nr:hypothetical protein [Calothrix membranacea FACHB-236]
MKLHQLRKFFCYSFSISIAVFITQGAHAQRTAVPLKEPPPAAVYNCAGYDSVFSVAPSILGEIQLDGNGNYSSPSYGEGQYIFDPETSRVRLISGTLAGWVGAWEIRGGDKRIRFPQTPNTRLKPDTSVKDTVCYPKKGTVRKEYTRSEIQKIADKIRNMANTDAGRSLPQKFDIMSAICNGEAPKINGRVLNANETAMLREELGCQNIPAPDR